MFTTLLISVALAGAPKDTSAIDWYKSAAYDALSAVGTDKFEKAIGTAEMRCDDRIPGCADNNDRLRSLDEKAQAEAEEATEKSEPEPAVDNSYRIQPAFYIVDKPTGIEYDASFSRPSAPWTGVEVRDLPGSFDAPVAKVCLVKDGVPIPMGPEVPFSESSERGTNVFPCPAANVHNSTVLYVPSGTTLMMSGPLNIERQVYVIDRAFICNRSGNERIKVKDTIDECRGIK